MEEGYGRGLPRTGEGEVSLNLLELIYGIIPGGARILGSLLAGKSKDPFSGDYVKSDFEAGMAEIATAKLLGVYYIPIFNDPDAADLIECEIRANCSRKMDDMVVRDRDRPKLHRNFISVLSYPPRFVICGWMPGTECVDPLNKYRGGVVGGPSEFKPTDAYWIPRADLHPIAELPELRALNRRPPLVKE